MKNISYISILLSFLSVTLYAQDARQIAEKSSKAIEFESLEMKSTLKIYDEKGNMRLRQVENFTRTFGETTKTYIRFLAPPYIKGTSMLIFDYTDKPDDMWLYLPSLRKARRIVSTEKSRSFMGSEFSNSDMAQPNNNDFTYKILGSTTISGSECWQVEARFIKPAVAAESGFAWKIMTIEKSSLLPVKIEFYETSGKLLKVMTLTDYHKQSNGKHFAFKMTMENEKNKRHSEIIVDTFKLGSGIPESKFSVSSLEE